MKIEKKEKNYTLITTDEAEFSAFYHSFLTQKTTFKNQHIVIKIEKNTLFSINDFSLFLTIAKQKKQNGTSFIIIATTVNIDELPEDINVVPTLQEAEDLLEMEAIERELGF